MQHYAVYATTVQFVNNKRSENTNTALTEIETNGHEITPTEHILAPLELSDYSHFLCKTNFKGSKGQDFTYEGIKTVGLNNGISTGEVRIEFLNDEKTEVLFYCTVTDRNGDTSSIVIQQNQTEHGRINPNWITKGRFRAMRNAIKARLPIQLYKTDLQKAIAAGKAKQSAIIEAQQALGVAWVARDESLGNIDKKTFYAAAQNIYGDAQDWDAETWPQVIEDLKKQSRLGIRHQTVLTHPSTSIRYATD